jgi:hypothetical protein
MFRRAPDPEAVTRLVSPTMKPATRIRRLTTRTAYTKHFPVHEHVVTVDPRTGNGVSDIVAGHFHRVVGGRIMPAESDGHEHALTLLPG